MTMKKPTIIQNEVSLEDFLTSNTAYALFDSLEKEYVEGLDSFESIQQYLANLWIDDDSEDSEGVEGIMNAKTVTELKGYASALMFSIEEKSPWNISEKELLRAVNCINNSIYPTEDYIGSVQLGDISVDFVLREYDNDIVLDYDVFAKTEQEYAESFTMVNKIPYYHADGGTILRKSNLTVGNIDMDSFKKLVLQDVVRFIEENKNIKDLLYVKEPVTFF